MSILFGFVVRACAEEVATDHVGDALDSKKSFFRKLRDELEEAQGKLDAIAEAADNADENEKDRLRANADAQRAIVTDKEAALGHLLRSRPLTLDEYDNEIVVRVVFAPISGGSQCLFYKNSAMDDLLSAPPSAPVQEEVEGELKDVKDPDAYRKAKNLKLARAATQKASGCSFTSSATPYHGTPPEVGSIMAAYMGGGVPPLTRNEVILSPLDVLPWLR